MDAISRELQPTSSVRAYFGWRMRYWRRRSGITQQALGERLGYDHSYLSKVETGDRWPPEDLPARMDRLLGAGGELIMLWPLVERERRHAIRRGQAGTPAPAGESGPSLVSTIEWFLSRAYQETGAEVRG